MLAWRMGAEPLDCSELHLNLSFSVNHRPRRLFPPGQVAKGPTSNSLIATGITIVIVTTGVTTVVMVTTGVAPVVIVTTGVAPVVIVTTGVTTVIVVATATTALATATSLAVVIILDTSSHIGCAMLPLALVVDDGVLHLISLPEHVTLLQARDVTENVITTLLRLDEAESTVIPTACNTLLPLCWSPGAGAGTGTPAGYLR